MKTIEVTPEQMKDRIARFKELRPQSEQYSEDRGIPKEAYEMITAKTLYLLLGPKDHDAPMARTPAVEGEPGLSMIIAECPPGDKPMLHAHFKTVETFLCLTGRFRIRWGDEGEHETYLEPFDMISVPRGVCRDFTNVTDETQHLLVIITGRSDEDFRDVGFAPSEGDRVREQFGPDVMKNIEKIGFNWLDQDDLGKGKG